MAPLVGVNPCRSLRNSNIKGYKVGPYAQLWAVGIERKTRAGLGLSQFQSIIRRLNFAWGNFSQLESKGPINCGIPLDVPWHFKMSLSNDAKIQEFLQEDST